MLMTDDTRDEIFQEMLKKANARKQSSMDQMEQNKLKQDDYQDYADSLRKRALLSGLTKSAAMLGSIGGKVADTSALDSGFAEMNKAGASALQGKRELYSSAAQEYKQADEEAWSAQTRPMELQAKQGSIRNQQQEFDSRKRQMEQDGRNADPNSQESRMAREALGPMYRQVFGKELPITVSASQLSMFAPFIERAHTAAENRKIRAAAEAESRKTRAEAAEQRRMEFGVRLEEARAKREETKATKDEKKAIEAGELGVEGFKLDPTGKIRPTKKEAEKARSAQSALADLKKQIAELRGLIDEDGSNIMFGANASRAASLATQMRLNYKTVKELGALNGPDMSILEKVIPDPSEWGQLFTKDSSAKARLDQLEKGAQQEFDAGIKSKGYVMDESSTGGSSGGGSGIQMEAGDQQALDYANANPNDPYSREIMKMLSQKYGGK